MAEFLSLSFLKKLDLRAVANHRFCERFPGSGRMAPVYFFFFFFFLGVAAKKNCANPHPSSCFFVGVCAPASRWQAFDFTAPLPPPKKYFKMFVGMGKRCRRRFFFLGFCFSYLHTHNPHPPKKARSRERMMQTPCFFPSKAICRGPKPRCAISCCSLEPAWNLFLIGFCKKKNKNKNKKGFAVCQVGIAIKIVSSLSLSLSLSLSFGK